MGLTDVFGGLMLRNVPKSGNPLVDALVPMWLTGRSIGSLSGLVGKFTSAGLELGSILDG